MRESDKNQIESFSGEKAKFADWKVSLEMYLKSKGLLGFICVADYDGTQSFEYNGEIIPALWTPVKPKSIPVSMRSEMTEDVTDDADKEKKRKKTRKSPVIDIEIDDETLEADRERQLKLSQHSASVAFEITHAVSVEIRSLIRGARPYDMWQRLIKTYGEGKVVDYDQMHKAFEAYRLMPGQKPSLFVAELDNKIALYSEVTQNVYSDLGKSLILRHRLPKEWDNRVASWYGQKDHIKYETLKDLVSKQSEFGEGEPKQETALNAVEETAKGKHKEKKPRGCFKCHSTEHRIGNCPKRTESEIREWEEKKKAKMAGQKKEKVYGKDRKPSYSELLQEMENIKKMMQSGGRRTGSDVRRSPERRPPPPQYHGRDRGPPRGRSQPRDRSQQRYPQRDHGQQRHDKVVTATS